ncbi:MAG: hypothetical protein AAGD25_27075 [Cyanobacteria bacterium P01_F01_bin.150]
MQDYENSAKESNHQTEDSFQQTTNIFGELRIIILLPLSFIGFFIYTTIFPNGPSWGGIPLILILAGTAEAIMLKLSVHDAISNSLKALWEFFFYQG